MRTREVLRVLYFFDPVLKRISVFLIGHPSVEKNPMLSKFI